MTLAHMTAPEGLTLLGLFMAGICVGALLMRQRFRTSQTPETSSHRQDGPRDY